MTRSSREAIVAAGLACCVSAQALLVTTQSSLIAFDHRVVEGLAGSRTPELISFFSTLTAFGKPSVVAAFALAAAYALHRYFKKEHLALGLFISVGGTILSGVILKDLIARARPYDFSHLYESSFAFPSGHASVAIALYGFLAFAIWHTHFPRAARAALAILLMMLALLISFSRIYLGVHYPTDIVAGLCIGIIWVILGVQASHMHAAHLKR